MSVSGGLLSMSPHLLCPADLEGHLRDLPVAAAVLPRLQQLLLRDDTAVDEVVELVRFDPALATRVMQAAGSAYYGCGRQIHSLEDAVTLLGLREAYRVTAAFAMSKFLNAPLRVYGLSAADYWRRSVACAFVMEEQAQLSWLDENVAYTVGLLHSVGLLLIDRHLRMVADPGLRLQEQPASPLPRQETRLLGMNHAQVAAFVLRKWNFGPEVVEPIERQFEPPRPGAQEAMTRLLVESRATVQAMVDSLPAPGRGTATDLTAEPPGRLATRILALERWAR